MEAANFMSSLICLARTSLPEIGGDAAFYFSSFNEEHIQQVFHDGMIIFEKEKIADRVRKRGMEFDWEEKAKQYLEVYQSLY